MFDARFLLPILAVLILFGSSVPTSALVIGGDFVTIDSSDPTDGTTQFTITFDGNVEGTPIAGLSSEADFTLSGYSFDGVNTSVTFGVTLTNTSSGIGGLTGSRVSVIGLDTNPDLATGGSSVSGGFNTIAFDSALPNGFGSLEVCFQGSNQGGESNSCQGGAGYGASWPAVPSSIDFVATLAFGGDVGEVDLTNFGVRYQSLSGIEQIGTSGTGRGTPGPSVPEPGSALLFALGWACVGIRRVPRLR